MYSLLPSKLRVAPYPRDLEKVQPFFTGQLALSATLHSDGRIP